MSSERWTPAEGELVAERFQLQREIARGGMGSIWLATHVTLDCPCAVKFIDEQYLDSDLLRDRFHREARAAARLRSRHVVQILDYGDWYGSPYIAMELLEGETLADRIDRQDRLSPSETMSVAKGVARALGRAAELGIVHRDLKPENVFIVQDGGREYSKVLDFGVVKLRDPNLLDSSGRTKTGVVVGTPYYMSPEQADGTKPVDPRSDLWSLAVILFECLTGEVPFYSEAFGNLVLKITSGPIPLPSDVVDDLPEALDDWWLHAAAREPDDRFQTAEQLLDALGEVLSGHPDATHMPPSIDGRHSWVTPESLRFTPVADRGRDSLPSSDSMLSSDSPPSSQELAAWSFPHSSLRPEDSRPPPASGPPPADATPARLAVSTTGQALSQHLLTPREALVQPVETFSGHAQSQPGAASRQPDAPRGRRWLWIGGGAGLGALLTTLLSGYLIGEQPALPSSGSAVDTVLAPGQDIQAPPLQPPSAAAEPALDLHEEEAPVAASATASASASRVSAATATASGSQPPASTPPASAPPATTTRPATKPAPGSAPPRPADHPALPRYGRE